MRKFGSGILHRLRDDLESRARGLEAFGSKYRAVVRSGGPEFHVSWPPGKNRLAY
jgi:hypothetical protein